MKKVLVVGFGAMGCRHVQALLPFVEQYEIHVLEPLPENIKANAERIGVNSGDLNWHHYLDEANADFDIAIIATSSGPRFQIVKALLEKGIRFFLLEKIVFQSASQFDQIINLIAKFKARAYCNFVNRYFNSYNDLRQRFSNRHLPINMLVHGGEFGLGCNAIHYIDIFQYISWHNDVEVVHTELALSENENRRGSQYKEFTGVLQLENRRGDKLNIVSDKGFSGGITIHVSFEENQFLLSEQTEKMFEVGSAIKITEFKIVPTSKLTHIILQDIFSGDCRLTQVSETSGVHRSLFNEFNKIVHGQSTPELLCPIT